MSSVRNPPWIELVQLVPVVTLALPFIAKGDVDLSRAGSGFLVAALLTIPVTGLVLYRRGTLNPILLGTALWLWLGALAFNLPIEPLRAALVEAQGFGLFVGVFVVALVASIASPAGFIGCRHPDAAFVRRSSLTLLGLAIVALAWSWLFRQNIRLGGGLPFIVLNVARRVLIVRAPMRPSYQ